MGEPQPDDVIGSPTSKPYLARTFVPFFFLFFPLISPSELPSPGPGQAWGVILSIISKISVALSHSSVLTASCQFLSLGRCSPSVSTSPSTYYSCSDNFKTRQASSFLSSPLSLSFSPLPVSDNHPPRPCVFCSPTVPSPGLHRLTTATRTHLLCVSPTTFEGVICG